MGLGGGGLQAGAYPLGLGPGLPLDRQSADLAFSLDQRSPGMEIVTVAAVRSL